MVENLALIAITTDTIRGEKSLRRMIQQLQSFGTIQKVSNIYLLETAATKEKVFQHVSELKSLEAAAVTFGALLTFNHEIQLLPRATLPNPRFLRDRLWLQCAAEVWGDYEHPIIAKTIDQILKSKQQQEANVEFFAQGRVLL